ncbi:MAG: hypothetical protein QOJ42_2120 [Acidobacteriaceae bacterium]|nr:hypothetical protein [Acidobacteriaceae bacterium]
MPFVAATIGLERKHPLAIRWMDRYGGIRDGLVWRV